MSWTPSSTTYWHGFWAVGFLVVATLVNSAEPLPPKTSEDVQTIIQRSVQSNDADWKAAPSYDYLERDLQPNGGTKTFQVVMIDGSPYQELVAVNGEPLSAQQQSRELKKLQHITEQRRNESKSARNDRISQYEKERKRDQALMQELTKAFDFALTGEQNLNGFDVYVLRATPRPGYHPPSLETQVLTGMKGTLWIDKNTYQWVKIEAQVIRPVSIIGFLARVEPGTHFELEKMPVGDNIWLARHFAMNSHAKVLSMFNHDSSADETYWNYRRSAPPASTGK